MEQFVDRLIREFESGALGRREFCQMLGLAAAAVAAGGAEANAASAGRGFTALGINHISYSCPDYRKARDFYANVFGMQVVKDEGRSANLTFGPEQGKGGTFIHVHDAHPVDPTDVLIDHFCLTVGNWDEAKVRAELKKIGVDKPDGHTGDWFVYDPFDYDVQFANSMEENPFKA